MSCENKSVLTCKNCKHYEQCDKPITCIGQCNDCNDTNCENNKNYKEKNKMKTLQIPSVIFDVKGFEIFVEAVSKLVNKPDNRNQHKSRQNISNYLCYCFSHRRTP